MQAVKYHHVTNTAHCLVGRGGHLYHSWPSLRVVVPFPPHPFCLTQTLQQGISYMFTQYITRACCRLRVLICLFLLSVQNANLPAMFQNHRGRRIQRRRRTKTTRQDHDCTEVVGRGTGMLMREPTTLMREPTTPSGLLPRVHVGELPACTEQVFRNMYTNT